MALKKIRILGDPVLRGKSQEVKEIDDSIVNLAREMMESINAGYLPGVGLAAPQIGVSKRVIVINYEDQLEAYINPEIEILDSGQEYEEEGCLSVPDIRAEVKRYKKVVFRALNLSGKEVEMEAEGMKARIFQHEIDHLDGLLFIDRLDKETKRKLMLNYNPKEQVD